VIETRFPSSLKVLKYCIGHELPSFKLILFDINSLFLIEIELLLFSKVLEHFRSCKLIFSKLVVFFIKNPFIIDSELLFFLKDIRILKNEDYSPLTWVCLTWNCFSFLFKVDKKNFNFETKLYTFIELLLLLKK